MYTNHTQKPRSVTASTPVLQEYEDRIFKLPDASTIDMDDSIANSQTQTERDHSHPQQPQNTAQIPLPTLQTSANTWDVHVASEFWITPRFFLPQGVLQCVQRRNTSATSFFNHECFVKHESDQGTCPVCLEDFDCTRAGTQCADCPIGNKRCCHVFHKSCLMMLLGLAVPTMVDTVPNHQYTDEEDSDAVKDIRCPYRCCKWCDGGKYVEEASRILPIIDRILDGDFDNDVTSDEPAESDSRWTEGGLGLFGTVAPCLVGWVALELGYFEDPTVNPGDAMFVASESIEFRQAGDERFNFWSQLLCTAGGEDLDVDFTGYYFFMRNMHNLWSASEPEQWNSWAEAGLFQDFKVHINEETRQAARDGDPDEENDGDRF
jgi:hypothetical protein